MLNNPLVPQVIGNPECPIMYRWTIFPPFLGSQSANKGRGKQPRKVPNWMPKLLLHHFVSGADERHPHDHPRPFWTFVVKGGYDDMIPCPNCQGRGIFSGESGYAWGCRRCGGGYGYNGSGIIVGTVMRPGMLRYRPAHHVHKTRVHKSGCWTLVLMGPLKRDWGFILGPHKWMPWKLYQECFGYGMRCE